jgi:PAS domain S-box-containing protein
MNDNLPSEPERSRAEGLRSQAKQRLRAMGGVPAGELGEVDVRAVLHELQVHQIELEMQNEELFHAQASLQELSANYQDLFDFAPVGYFRLDEHHRILEANLSGAALLGMNRTQVIQQHFGNFVEPSARARFAVFADRALSSDRKQSCEVELLRDGQAIYVVLEAISSDNHRFLRVTAFDITERKQMEQELQESEHRLHRMFEDDLTGDFIATPDGRILLCNPAFVRIFGFLSREDAMGSNVATLYPAPGDFTHFVNLLRECRTLERHECDRRRCDGALIRVVENAVASFDEHGAFVQFQGYVYDDTQRREAEIQLVASLEELRRSQQELLRKERLAVLGLLAGTVAHDIRTPLTVMQNSLYFLENTLRSADETTRDVLGEMKRAIGNSNRIITEMLDYVREPSPVRSPFPVGDAISSALKFVPLTKGICFEGISSEAAGIEVYANLDQVTRILINLIQNAVQAMPNGGELKIEVCRQDDGRIATRVCDTGCGIPAENLQKVFEPLFSTKNTGIGLGLPIARRYAELNGGELTVESGSGGGTRFRLLLTSPAQKAQGSLDS